jgi:hypothetical protein
MLSGNTGDRLRGKLYLDSSLSELFDHLDKATQVPLEGGFDSRNRFTTHDHLGKTQRGDLHGSRLSE